MRYYAICKNCNQATPIYSDRNIYINNCDKVFMNIKCKKGDK